MTPAEELRAAAKAMRERAEAAQPGPWSIETWKGMGGTYASVMVPFGPGAPTAKKGLTAMSKLGTQNAGTAAHIASWDPPMALAVADWLDAEAEHYDDLAASPYTAAGAAFIASNFGGEIDPALKVARAYTGGAS